MKKIISIIIFFLSAVNVFPQTGWIRVAPQPTEDNMIKVVSTTDNILFIITENNSLLRSTDNGKLWETIYIKAPLETRLNNIKFVNNNTGWIVGSKGVILKTTDKGDTWIRQESYTNFEIWNIFLLNETTGYVTGRGGTVLKTTDGGSNWYFKGIKQQNLIFDEISFISENVGYSVASLQTYGPPNYLLYKTTNSGNDWVIDSLSYLVLNSVYYFNQNTIVVTANDGSYFQLSSRLMLSTDSGLNWVNISPDTSLRAFYFKYDSGQFWCILGNDTLKILYKSNDFGNTWQVQSTLPESISYFNITPTGLFITARSGSIYSSTNSGATWNKIYQDAIPLAEDVQFINESTGFLKTLNDFYKTTSGGLEWKKLNVAPIQYFHGEIYFINESTGFVSRRDTTMNLFKSIDGGESFTEFVIPDRVSLLNINFDEGKIRIISRKRLGFLEYKSGYIESTDMGNTWQLKEPEDWNLDGVFNINFSDNIAYACSQKYLYKSINGGNSWTIIDSTETSSGFYEMQFINSQFGWISKYDFTFNITSDGGATWSSINLNDYNISYAAISGYFTDENNGWIVANVNVGDTLYNSLAQVGILKTTDGGNIWRRTILKSKPNTTLKINMVNENLGFISNGYSLYKTTDGGVINIRPIAINIVNDFLLQQNYPNPFNPVTNIKFSLPTTQYTILKVFDITGREIATLVNEQLNAGEYNYQFNADEFRLSSGVFFYQLSAGDFIQTRKLILIK